MNKYREWRGVDGKRESERPREKGEIDSQRERERIDKQIDTERNRGGKLIGTDKRRVRERKGIIHKKCDSSEKEKGKISENKKKWKRKSRKWQK